MIVYFTLFVRRVSTSQSGRIAENLFVRRPEKYVAVASDCVLYIICPASVDVTVRKNYSKSIYPAGALKICYSDADGVRKIR